MVLIRCALERCFRVGPAWGMSTQGVPWEGLRATLGVKAKMALGARGVLYMYVRSTIRFLPSQTINRIPKKKKKKVFSFSNLPSSNYSVYLIYVLIIICILIFYRSLKKCLKDRICAFNTLCILWTLTTLKTLLIS